MRPDRDRRWSPIMSWNNLVPLWHAGVYPGMLGYTQACWEGVIRIDQACCRCGGERAGRRCEGVAGIIITHAATSAGIQNWFSLIQRQGSIVAANPAIHPYIPAPHQQGSTVADDPCTNPPCPERGGGGGRGIITYLISRMAMYLSWLWSKHSHLWKVIRINYHTPGSKIQIYLS